jgi:hypothetical protein
MNDRIGKWSIVVAVLVDLPIPSLAGAHAEDNDPNAVHACIGDVSKIVRIVGVNGSCVASHPPVAETPAHWAAANQSAAALGDGQCGLTDHSSPGDWRLPSRDEWIATLAGAIGAGTFSPCCTAFRR